MRHVTRSHDSRQRTFRERIQFVRIEVLAGLLATRDFRDASKKDIYF
jgi:hypothetical protein